jgi:DNA polymerase III epsilon subunit
LFNDAASELCAGEGKLGIGRMLTTVLQPAALRGALTELNRRHTRGGDGRGVVACECAFFGPSAKVLAGRMRLVVEHDGLVSGYVLVLAADSSGSTEVSAPRRAIDILERPVFYDFDLFGQDFDRALLDTPLPDLSVVVFDTETTGLEPSRGDQIVQIAGVRVLNARLLADDRFDELVNPGMPIPRASTRIHGISDEMVAGKDSVAEVLRRFHEFVGDAVLLAHNAAFDMKFLKLKEHEIGLRFDSAVLDTLLLSVVLQPSHATHTLDAIASRFGIENHDRHSALGDAVTTAEVFVRMIGVLEARGIRDLGQALEASDRIQEIKRLQERF